MVTETTKVFPGESASATSAPQSSCVYLKMDAVTPATLKPGAPVANGGPTWEIWE